mmetsp:Transcript_56948/g.161680  ORF Transcript_56948/g.161680 Transcript_56948/m.161680 type:complete len:99 (-) Transcript_56948:37-333(-)|eukprot:CAMPEP_0168395194 /NCGR_PEP_ID=MMETSP0228-20121227/19922_1 /TAXON_ID=133427 /ORGANISM="Protoceratium reticulatum, Strain CCCM 535 (=CCMP 1889)" /LENGTH=98 /DNA_ID=CAMNT_0008408627 /DNA_START=54 /DNA_END=350 /DNA_ORIENTATION=+
MVAGRWAVALALLSVLQLPLAAAEAAQASTATPSQAAEDEFAQGWAFAGGSSSSGAGDAQRTASVAEEALRGLCSGPMGARLPMCEGQPVSGEATVNV